MANTWIVAADSSRARILQVAGQERLVEIEDMLNPAARLDNRDLTSDAHPRFSGHGGDARAGAGRTGGPGSDRQEMGAAEHATELFAKRLGDYLDKARTQHRYDELLVLAPPKFLGMLRKKLGREVEKLVADEVPKDLSWFDSRELERYVKNNNKPG